MWYHVNDDSIRNSILNITLLHHSYLVDENVCTKITIFYIESGPLITQLEYGLMQDLYFLSLVMASDIEGSNPIVQDNILR